MRVLIVSSSMAVGGAEKLAINIANNLVFRGIDCHLLAIKGNEVTLSILLNKQVKFWLGKKKGVFDLAYILRLRKMILKIDPDIILCESAVSYISVVLSGLGLKVDYQIVSEIHAHQSFTFQSRIFNSVFFYLISKTDDQIVVTYSRQIDVLSKKYGISPERFKHIPNGVALDRFKRKKKLELKHGDTLKILHIANFRVEKDPWTLFKALVALNENYSNWTLTYRGKISQENKKEVNAFLKKNKIEKKVIFVEFCDEITELFEAAHVFVMSSIAEALPMAAIEAIAMSTPCILTDVGGCSDIVEDEVSGYLVPAGKHEILANRLFKLTKFPEKLSNMSSKSRDRAVSHFEANAIMDSYVELFKGLTKQNHL